MVPSADDVTHELALGEALTVQPAPESTETGGILAAVMPELSLTWRVPGSRMKMVLYRHEKGSDERRRQVELVDQAIHIFPSAQRVDVIGCIDRRRHPNADGPKPTTAKREI